MPLAADFSPVTDWTIPWNAFGPFTVDSWDTSYRDQSGKALQAHRVVGKYGFQLHTADGAVLQFSKEYAQELADAANNGLLTKDDEPKRQR